MKYSSYDEVGEEVQFMQYIIRRGRAGQEVQYREVQLVRRGRGEVQYREVQLIRRGRGGGTVSLSAAHEVQLVQLMKFSSYSL